MTELLDLRESEDRFDRTYPPSVFLGDKGDNYTVTDTVGLTLRLQKNGEKYRLRGLVRTTLRLSCSRCLESFDVPSKIEVDLLYLPQSSNHGDAEGEIGEDELSTAFYRNDQIDLSQMMAEQFQLALPMKPLCREECRGLCSVCGCNLNEKRCVCDTRWRDPRLAALKNLFSSSR